MEAFVLIKHGSWSKSFNYNDVLIRNTFNFVRIGLRVLPFSRAMILKSWTAFRK